MERYCMLRGRYKYILVWTILGVSVLPIFSNMKKKLNAERKKANKYLELYRVMAQWIEVSQNGQFIAEWLKERRYMSVAIYGMSLIGERLYIDLTDRGIQVAYGIDRLSRGYLDGIKMYMPAEELPQVDAVIVTAIVDFDAVREQMKEKINCPIFSFKDILNEIVIQ